VSKIYSLKEIREKLKDRKISIVCERLSLSRQAVYNIMNGANVSFSTYQKLVNYLFLEEKDCTEEKE
jgi:predicted DNA-binding protein YlxM (UPF0122 family)